MDKTSARLIAYAMVSSVSVLTQVYHESAAEVNEFAEAETASDAAPAADDAAIAIPFIQVPK